jgi:ABC-type oligopeptide transport system substrate-binding subunit
VPTRLEESEIKSMIVDLQRGNFEIALTGAQDVPAYEAYLERFETGASYNTGRYSSAAFDGLLAAARRLSDPAARAATLRRAEAVHTQDFVAVPLFQEVSRNLVSPRVRGWVDNPYDLHPSRFLSLAPP